MARFDLGLEDEEFGDLTYRQLDALVERLKERERKEYIRTGIVAAAVINFSYRPPEKPAKILDFVPDMQEEARPDLSKMTPAEAEKYWLGQFAKKNYTVK